MRIFVLITGSFGIAAGVYLLWTGRNPALALTSILFWGGCNLIAAWDIVQPKVQAARRDAFVNKIGRQRTLVVKSDIVEFVVYEIGCAGFVAVGVMMMLTENQPWLGLLATIFFGAGALLLSWQIIDRRPRLIIDSDGVFDRMTGLGRIVWEDIESAQLQSVVGNHFISLELRDPSLYVMQMSWIRRLGARANTATGFSAVSLNLTGITVSPEEVLQIVQGYILERKMREAEDQADSFKAGFKPS